MLKDKGDLFQDLFQSVVSWILVHCCRGKNIHPSSQETIIREYINMMTTRKCLLKNLLNDFALFPNMINTEDFC